MKSVKMGMTALSIFLTLGFANDAFAYRSFTIGQVNLVANQSQNGTRLDKPVAVLVGKSINGLQIRINFTNGGLLANDCLAMASRSIGTSNKMIINVFEDAAAEYTIMGCAIGDVLPTAVLPLYSPIQ